MKNVAQSMPNQFSFDLMYRKKYYGGLKIGLRNNKILLNNYMST